MCIIHNVTVHLNPELGSFLTVNILVKQKRKTKDKILITFESNPTQQVILFTFIARKQIFDWSLIGAELNGCQAAK